MKTILLLLLSGTLFLSCSKKDLGSTPVQQITQEHRDRLRVVTLSLGDMELISEKYKEEGSIRPLSVNQSDEERLGDIFASIEDKMKDNEGCEKFRKQNNQYDRYVGVEFTGSKCPMILDAETALKTEEGIVGVKNITSDKAISYDVRSEELLTKLDVKKYAGFSKLVTDSRRKDLVVTLSAIHDGQGQGMSQVEGDFKYSFHIERRGSGGPNMQTISTVDAIYLFSFQDFEVTLTSSMSQIDSEPEIKYYYINGVTIDRAEFSKLLGTLAMPENMVKLTQ